MTGDEFKAVRLRKGLSVRVLGAKVGVTDPRTLRRYESGARPVTPRLAALMEQIDKGLL